MREHPDQEIQAAIVRLCDALCSWERATGMGSVLILKESGYKFRAMDGKPEVPEDVPDDHLLSLIDTDNGWF